LFFRFSTQCLDVDATGSSPRSDLLSAIGGPRYQLLLSIKPPELLWAIALGGLCILLWASAAGGLLLRWIYALPLWLDGHRPFLATLGASWNSTRKWFFFLLRVTFACLAVIIVVLLILEGSLFIAAGFVFLLVNAAINVWLLDQNFIAPGCLR
jgi:hypothetical protein